MKRYKKLLLALAAIASIYVVKATGLDRGLIDEAFNAVVEAIVGVDELPEKADARALATDPPIEVEPLSTSEAPR